MSYVNIKASPLIEGASPVRIYYRETGRGIPLVILHGGWGYQIYPFDHQLEAFGDQFRILIPDRTGYGRSMRVSELPVDFHQRAAMEMMEFLNALNIEKAVLWGHSDGAVIATMMALASPERFHGLILEAFHYYRRKHESREFFRIMASNPDQFGEKICGVLSSEHGEDYWRRLLTSGGRAWLQLGDDSKHDQEDLYEGRFPGLAPPTIFIFGSRDPRTEANEIEAVRNNLAHARIHLIEQAYHSPHSERAAFEECNRLAGDFLQKIKAGVQQTASLHARTSN
ncbi:MAG TPA: alpha/beta hydrolase [Pyrinomonadaceae bacterium]|jgi:pimeloyl-ACP methyl ester carboxylesterase